MRVLIKYAFAALAVLLPLKMYARGRYPMLFRGIVVATADPEGRHRIKVAVPDLFGAVAVWALPCVPYDGDPAVRVPPPGSTIWILFEEGDSERPVWIGWLPGTARRDPVAPRPSGP